jgi:hypothetical protein
VSDIRLAERGENTRSVSLQMDDVEKYALARESYRPHHIRVLLVAESPPSSGGYFYFRRTIGKDHLFRETMKALGLWPHSKKMGKGIDKAPYLNQFMLEKFFLIDTCDLPVDKLPRKSRKLQIAKGASTLPARILDLDPSKVLLVKKTVFGPARDSLRSAGLGHRILNRKPIPFPSHGHQATYRTELERLTQRN